MKHLIAFPTVGKVEFYINNKQVPYLIYKKSKETDESEKACYSYFLWKKIREGEKALETEKSKDLHRNHARNDLCFKLKKNNLKDVLEIINESDFKNYFKFDIKEAQKVLKGE